MAFAAERPAPRDSLRLTGAGGKRREPRWPTTRNRLTFPPSLRPRLASAAPARTGSERSSCGSSDRPLAGVDAVKFLDRSELLEAGNEFVLLGIRVEFLRGVHEGVQKIRHPPFFLVGDGRPLHVSC
jgi:hypothetical protein